MQASLLQQVRIFLSLPPQVHPSLLESIGSSGDPVLVAELARSCPPAAFDLCKAYPICGKHPMPCFALLARINNKEQANISTNLLIQIVKDDYFLKN